MRLAREGKLITHHTDHSVLTLMSLSSVIERDYLSVNPEMPMGQLVHVISQSHTNFIPVLDEAGTLLGEVDITNIRHVIFRTELYQKFQVSQVMTQVKETVGVNDPMEDAMRKFEATNAEFLPVVDVENRLVGYISRTRIYSMYRTMVADLSAE